MSTPIYDSLKAGEAWKAATLGRPPIIISGPLDAPIIFKPEPAWKTFLRCLKWWKR